MVFAWPENSDINERPRIVYWNLSGLRASWSRTYSRYVCELGFLELILDDLQEKRLYWSIVFCYRDKFRFSSTGIIIIGTLVVGSFLLLKIKILELYQSKNVNFFQLRLITSWDANPNLDYSS